MPVWGVVLIVIGVFFLVLPSFASCVAGMDG